MASIDVIEAEYKKSIKLNVVILLKAFPCYIVKLYCELKCILNYETRGYDNRLC